ncbi:MAG: alpha-galactosidase [Oscillospiraceae bacterium]|nr:alpha-galactosidase [Oscillospiraceae bacterium]
MISYQDGIFHLRGETVSMVLKVDRWGLLELLHFGEAVADGDAEAFRFRPGLGWGSSVLLDDTDTESCPDALGLAWSGPGRGDYRESPLELGGEAVDLRYESHTVSDGIVPTGTSLVQAHGEGESLTVTLSQPGAKLQLIFTLFGDVICRRTVLENTGDRPLTVTKLMSSLLDLQGSFLMTTFDGGWIRERGKHTVSVGPGRIVNESTTGASSNRHATGVLLSETDTTEDHGRVYGFDLVWSGNHHTAAQQSLQGLTRVVQGVSPAGFALTLEPGAKLRTPEAVMTFSTEGFGGLSAILHRFVSDHIIPAQWRRKERPVLFNSWEGCMFDFDHRRLVGLAKDAKDLGCELFVLDDGWFGQRNDDTAGLGDYTVNKKKLPHGLKGLGEKINSLGMSFGLWFEPESVNMDSDLYRAHPDWALTDGFQPLLGRHQLLLDLTKPEVRDYIVENVSAILDSAPISYVKWDMNRHSVALGVKAYDHILGLYEVLARIFGPRPQILLETCASGGDRSDLGMLCFGPQVWCSDNTDPICRQTIQGSLSYLYPQSTFGAHVSAAPHAQTLRSTPLCTRGYVSFFGCLGYELDLKHLLGIEKDEIRAQIGLYKQYRQVFQFGQFRRLDNGWQVSGDGITIAACFRGLVEAAPGYERLRLKGLDPQKRYRFHTVPRKLRIGQFGSLVKHVAPVNLDPNGLILRTADRHITLPDGEQAFTASGAALMAGIRLLPLFRGTGYHKDQRTLTDFGAELYIIEEDQT